jgi:hypothetical protein
LGQSTLVVLCAGSTLLLAQSYAQIGGINKLSGASPSQLASTFRSGFFLILVRLNLGFTIEGNLPLCSSYLPLGVPNWVASTANQAFFWRCCRGKRGFLQEESLASNLLLCYCYAYFLNFIFPCIFLSKIENN